MLRIPRVEALLGSSLDEVTEESLARLVDGAVDEDSDLEFKRELYGNGDSERRDLAGDVAALANLGGGLLIIGIGDVDGCATERTPQPLSETEELRMRQILAANIAPHLPVTIRRVPSSDDDQFGYYLLGVPRSPHAPHAVRAGSGLRYPRRDGRNVRWLAESEVADAYRNRFLEARSQIDRIDAIRQELIATTHELSSTSAWLVLVAVPDLPGHAEMTRAGLRDLQQFPGAVGRRILRLRPTVALQYAPTTPRAGHRRAVLRFGSPGPGEAYESTLHLYDDGAFGLAVKVGWAYARRPEEPVEHVNVDDEVLTQELMFGLAAAARHAVQHAATGGTSAAAAHLTSSHLPMKLSHTRGQLGMGGHWASDVAEHASGISEHTIDLTAIEGSPTELLVATRLVVTDLLQSLGVPECPQIAPDGSVRFKYWSGDHARIEATCAELGVPMTADTLES